MSEVIKAVLREYLTSNSPLRGSDEISDSTPLARYGILDSIAVLELVLFLEDRFGIEFTPRDLDRRRLETIEHIEELVRQKVTQKRERSGGSQP